MMRSWFNKVIYGEYGEDLTSNKAPASAPIPRRHLPNKPTPEPKEKLAKSTDSSTTYRVVTTSLTKSADAIFLSEEAVKSDLPEKSLEPNSSKEPLKSEPIDVPSRINTAQVEAVNEIKVGRPIIEKKFLFCHPPKDNMQDKEPKKDLADQDVNVPIAVRKSGNKINKQRGPDAETFFELDFDSPAGSIGFRL